MRKILFFVPVLILFLSGFCDRQPYKYIYYFDELLNHTTFEKATIIARGYDDSGALKLDFFSAKNNSLYISAHYTDSSLKELQGEFTEYHTNGKIKKQGNYFQDEKEGLWKIFDTLGLIRNASFYKHDKLLTQENSNYFKDETLCSYSFKDDVADTLKTITYNENGQVIGEVFFKGNNGISKRFEGFKTTTDELTTRECTAAIYPGGDDSWINYLMTNLDAAIPIDKGAERGLYEVIVRFTISADGKLSDVIAETKFGYGMEKEVIRIIKSSPDWVPAVQYGHKTMAYRRQPVTFSVGQR